MIGSHDSKSSPQNQDVRIKTEPTPAHTLRTPTPRTYNGKKYYCASDVAKIIGVDRTRVVRWNNELWHGAQWFTADLKTHDGVYLYEVERVMQLKSIYHPKWMRGSYEPAPVPDAPQKDNLLVKLLMDEQWKKMSDQWKAKSEAEEAERQERARLYDIQRKAEDLKYDIADIEHTLADPCFNDNDTSMQELKAEYQDKLLSFKADLAKHIADHPDFTFSDDIINAATPYNANHAIKAPVSPADAPDNPAHMSDTSAPFFDAVNDGKKNKPANTADNQQISVQNLHGNNSTNDGFAQLPKENFPEEYERLIKLDIDSAQIHLDDLPENQRRGLTVKTLRHFKCGFLRDWILTKSRAEFHCGLYADKLTGEVKKLPPPSERIIIPTASLTHFNAVATPAARLAMKKDFWKQHAGSMELFTDPDAALKDAELILIVEGEFDCMSIWQCSGGKIFSAAILGCNNWKKTLLPILADIRDKKLLLLLDNDTAGKKAAEKFLDELLQRGCLAVSKNLFDALPTQEQKFFGHKVDANDILKQRGNEFLYRLLEKIIADAQPDFDALAKKIAQQNIFMQEQAKLAAPKIPAQSSRKKSSTRQTDDNVDRDEITLILKDFVHARELDREDWRNVGMIMKRSGFTLEDFQQWSKDDTRYNAARCETDWNSFWGQGEHIGEGHTVATLISLAKKFGYKPTRKKSVPVDALMTTREVADFLGVSLPTVKNWRQRKLFGCYFFSADEKRGDTLYYYRERVEQLKAVYQKGILQNMYKLARKNPETPPPTIFQKSDSSCCMNDFQKSDSSCKPNDFGEELSFRHREFLILEEVADFFGVDKSTISRWVKNGILKEDMLGHNGDLYFAIDNVLKFNPPSKKDDDTQSKLDEWQAVNGKINPELLDKISDAKKFVEGISVDTFNAALTAEFSVRSKVALCKLFLPDTAKLFFDILKDAKKIAADKIKSLREQKADIPPELQALADLSKSEFKKEIDSIAATLRRNNKQAVKDNELAALNAKRDAQQKALEALNESTKKNVPDCPLALNIPAQCVFNEQGVQIVDYSGRFPKNFIAAQSPLIPTKILREPSKHTTQYEVAVKANGFWRRIIVDGDELADPKKILRLAKDGGALIEDAKYLTKFFARIIKANEDKLPEINCYTQPGWQSRDFRFFAYPSEDSNYLVRRAGFDYNEIFSKSGDPELWKNTFRRVTDASPLVRIFIGFALAAPLVRPLNILNPQIHLSAPNDSGKSGLMKFAASIFGNPAEMLKSFAATPKNSISVAAASNDLPSFFDELETLKKAKEDTLSQMIYEFAQGIANQANKRDGTPRPTVRFKGVKLSTAERPLLKSHDQRGAFKRLVQLDTRSAIFEPSLAAELHFISENNFGLFGQDWINFVIAHLKDIKDKYMEFGKLFAVLPDKREAEPTLFKSCAVAAIAFYCFKICIGFDSHFDNIYFCKDLNDINNLLPTPRELDDSTRAITDLQSFIAGHDRFFMHESDNKDFDYEATQSAFECYGKIFNNGEVAFFPTALKKILETELGFASADALITEWAAKDMLRCGKGRNSRYATRINGKSINAYRFKAGVLLSND